MSSSLTSKFPHFEKIPQSRQLHVDGKPYLILGAELQNSSMSSAEYMKPIWPRLVDMNINTVLGNVTWEQIEPEEGRFDFHELDLVVDDARASGLRLILLWFGSFKNGMCLCERVFWPSFMLRGRKGYQRTFQPGSRKTPRGSPESNSEKLEAFSRRRI